MDATPPPPIQAQAPGARCRNCGAPMLGDFCHACGQPQRSLVRHFATLVDDFVDNVLNLDNRTWRTLVPLYFQPGHLTVEYLEGRRVRYVAPLRLYLFLSVIAFLVVSASADLDDLRGEVRMQDTDAPVVSIDAGDSGGALAGDGPLDEAGFREAMAELEREMAEVPAALRPIVRDAARAELERRRAAAAPPAPPDAPTAPAALASDAETDPAAAAATPAQPADARAQPAAGDAGAAPGIGIQSDGDDGVTFNFGDGPWHPVSNPLVFDWLPDGINAAINDEIGVMQDNALRARERPELIVRKALSLAPTALLLVLPLFALLLKLAYVWRSRLYMEHLIFALHNHSYICLSLIVASALEWLVAHAAGHAWISAPASTLAIAAWSWIPVYLVLSLRRVYGQGWLMTLTKAFGIGIAYSVLLSFGFAATFLASLAVL
jgi:hypothetical protein